MIARGTKALSTDMVHVPELAPSLKTFRMYQGLQEKGAWNKETFYRFYVPLYLKDLCRPNSHARLMHLVDCMKAGGNVELLCYCYDEELCHRSIVGGIIQGMGFPVVAKDDYSKFYNLWRQMREVAEFVPL